MDSTKKLSLLSTLSLTPYATPIERNVIHPWQEGRGTYKTLFTFDPCKEKPRNIRESFFEKLDESLPKIYALQTENSSPAEPQNLHQDSLPRFLHSININPTISIESLLPVPSLAGMDFSVLFNSYLFRVPPDRASYVIHYYIFQTGLKIDNVTDFFENCTIQQKDEDYFIKLMYSLYTKSLIDKPRILVWLISKFPPSSIEIFKDEIFNSFKFLSLAIHSNYYKEYIKMMECDLYKYQSQLIQFAISMIYQLKEFNEHFMSELFPLMNPPMIKRVNSIINAIKYNNISIFLKIFLKLNLEYPYYDIPKILEEFKISFLFIEIKEKTKLAIDLISLIQYFPMEDLLSVSAFIIEFISELNIPFPLKEFVDFIYSNLDVGFKYTQFFFELQEHQFFNYSDFFELIKKSSRHVSEFETTYKVLELLPPIDYSQVIHGKIMSFFRLKNEVLLKNEKILNEFIADIEKNYPKAIDLPPYFRYFLGYQIINDKKYNFYSKSFILSKINLGPMIFTIFQQEKNPKFSHLTIRQMRKFIPFLYSCGILDSFLKYVMSEDNAIDFHDLHLFLKIHFSDSSYLKNYINDIEKICNSNDEFIDTDKIKCLANDYSYLFNVFLLDDFYKIRTINDFSLIFPIFLKNLLSFECLFIDTFWNFFISFIDSFCIFRPVEFFLDKLICTSLFDIKITEMNKNVLTQFFYNLFSYNLFCGNEFLNLIFKILVSKRIDINDCVNANHLLDILSKVIEKAPHLFSFATLIEIPIANWLTIKNPYLNRIVKSFSSQYLILTNSVIESFQAPPSNYTALFFNFLPPQLLDDDIDQAIGFYLENISYLTMQLWTIWIKYRPLYLIESITEKVKIESEETEITRQLVIPNYLLNDYSDYYNSLIYHISHFFLDVTAKREEYDSFKMDLFVESFKILCKNQKIMTIAFNSIVEELNKSSMMFPYDSIRLACELLPYLNEEQIKALLEPILKIEFEILEEDSSLFKFCYFFLVCFASICKNIDLKELLIASDKLLHLIPDAYQKQIPSNLFITDCFNFFVAINIDKGSGFHKLFYDTIKNNLERIKKKIKSKILWIDTPKMLEQMEDPPYVNNNIQSSSFSSELLTGSGTINDIFVDDGDYWLF